MKALLKLQLCGLAVLGLLTSACTLLQLSPSLTLTVRPEYTSATVNIPYEFQTLSRNSDGSAQCSYSLSKYDSTSGGYAPIGGGNYDTTLQSKGTLSFPLTTIFNTTAGSSVVDGLYELTFSVLSDTYDQNGNRIPFPFLTQTAYFSVHTLTGPEIYRADPPIVNATQSSATVTFTGTAFTTGGTLNPVTDITGWTYGNAQTISATVTGSGVGAGNMLGVTFTDSQGTTSPVYYLPVVGNVAVTGVSPSSASNRDSALSLTVAGSYLGYWSNVTITDAGGHTATMRVQQVASSSGTTYLRGIIDLTSLTTLGTATLTVTNPDGSPKATTTFTVTS